MELTPIFKKLIYTDIINTIIYIAVYSLLIPTTLYTRGILQKTKILSMLVIWHQRRELVEKGVYAKLKLLRAIKLPPSITNLGKKILFTKIKQIEVNLFLSILTQYINELTKMEAYPESRGIIKTTKQFWLYLKDYNRFTSLDIILDFLERYEDHIESIPDILISTIKKDMLVDRKDIIRYQKRHREIPHPTPQEVEEIKATIQESKARIAISKYEEMMLVYRKQIISNLISQLNSNKPTHILLKDILENSLIPVYRNMHDTVHIYINKLNGEFENINYKGHELT